MQLVVGLVACLAAQVSVYTHSLADTHTTEREREREGRSERK